MKEIELFSQVGAFAENKDIARRIRTKQILPAIDRGEGVTLNFRSVDSATQSFIHALISDVIRKHGDEVIDQIYFKNCSETVQKIVEIVVEYMQEAD